MDISWFMGSLNEAIARSSNQEDICKSRFWEACFKSQAILDEGAVLSAMACVDLNSVRAGVAETPEVFYFTLIKECIQFMHKELKKQQPKKSCNALKQPSWLMPLRANKKSNDTLPHINFKFSDYLELVDYIRRVVRDDKCGVISSELSPILTRLNLTNYGWLSRLFF